VTRCFYLLLIISLFVGAWPEVVFAQTGPLSETRRTSLEKNAGRLQAALDEHPDRGSSAWADTAVFAKGLTWALKYDREFSPAHVQLLERAVVRTEERLASLAAGKPAWQNQQGKLALGYVSAVDGSVQPYGVIVPQNYDPAAPIRLDVVLHGSSRPVGMSELRFISRFENGDDSAAAPEQPFIELHPLGRVENCYRWAGETDVFEAIEDVCRRYNVDRDRIVLRGMSMGASGTWHLGLKYPDRFAALGPYCGYVDTHRFSETPLKNFVRVGQLPDHQEAGLHMLDSVDYAANAGVVPAIACMGEKDVFFQAHVIMGEAMRREGLQMVNLISPGTGHVIDPVTHAEQIRRIAEHVAAAPRRPSELRFVTWTLKYNRCHWLEILGLEQHYARAEFSAKLADGVLVLAEPQNITRFAISPDELPERPQRIRIGKPANEFPFPAGRVELARVTGKWQLVAEGSHPKPTGKRPGLQGPIDDAFTTPFLCVRGTGQPWNEAVQKYADASLRRFADEWHQYLRGELPIKDDVDVTEADLRTRNLILFGDPGSNRLIARSLPDLPLSWSPTTLHMNGQDFPASDHVPALIAPNPLPGAESRYLVLNTGHTFHESELSSLNYLLFPRWGDWAVLKPTPLTNEATPPTEQVLRAGYFNEQWNFTK
jgi:pimeloyl-ACP methyl ester carboxylesterase